MTVETHLEALSDVIAGASIDALNLDGGRVSERVGRVVGVGHTSSQEFRVVLDEGSYLAVDDLVVVRTDVPGVGELRTYGVVVESEATYEGAAYESDVHRISEQG